VEGELPHSCQSYSSPHSIKVGILKKDNTPGDVGGNWGCNTCDLWRGPTSIDQPRVSANFP
jgi:hypothetical protein